MGILGRLYRGQTNIDFVGPRRKWYLASAIATLVCVASLAIQGFNFGIEFAGGNQFQAPAQSGTTLEQARAVIERDLGHEVTTAQQAGTGANASYVIKTGELSADERREVRRALGRELGVPANQINISVVSPSWGQSVTRQAGIGLVVFLVLVAAYLWIRFEQKMAIAALIALGHDLLFTAGIYSLVGFEVTPGTVVGMLTILGYSLYDTVVVFDKVHENTRGLLGSSRQTFGEAANLAVNQTLMRSINTTIIGILPVAGLLFVGAGLLGVGTLKDLALVLFVGMLIGTYSSLFIATPSLVDFKMLEPRYRAQAKRVAAKRSGEDTSGKAARRQAKRAAEAKKAKARRAAADDLDESDEYDETEDLVDEQAEDEEHDEDEATDRELAGMAPRPGARPDRSRRRAGGRGGSRGGTAKRKR